ncbi:MAG: NUDIX domain-containing protein [Cyanobacteria bacterium RI_101]|nr:NUDIX domain-containing protein [Cyanobacteria bacterium RI_101]
MTNFSPTNNSTNPKREVALAILHQEGRYLLQLRDNLPTILYPGHWSLFGGHLDPGESPADAVIREIWEEIAFNLENPVFFDCYGDDFALRHVFAASLTVPLTALSLQEGWDWGLISPAEIANGSIYSAKAGDTRPLGDIHQKILLDFIRNRAAKP